MNYNIPSLFTLLSRQSLLRRCRACCSTTVRAQGGARRDTTRINTEGVAHGPRWSGTRNTTRSASIDTTQSAHTNTQQRSTGPVSKAQQQAFDRLVEDYLVRLKNGEVFDGIVWKRFFQADALTTPDHAITLLRHARNDKILTGSRYYSIIKYLAYANEFVGAQLALNAMIEDGMRLANWQIVILCKDGIQDHHFFFRVLSLMDVHTWDYANMSAAIAVFLREVVKHVIENKTDAEIGLHLGHLLCMVPHMDSPILEAMVTATSLSHHLAPAFEYINSTGRLPTFKIYEHFASFLPVDLLPAMYQQMRSRGLLPTAKMYKDTLERLEKENDTPTDFLLRLVTDMINTNKQTIDTAFTALHICLELEQLELAFKLCENLLKGPFTQNEITIVSENLSQYMDKFEGTPHNEPLQTLVTEFMQNPPLAPVPPHLPIMDEEW